MGYHKRRQVIIEEVVDAINMVIDDGDDLSDLSTQSVIYTAVMSALSDLADCGSISGSYATTVYAPYPMKENEKGLEVEVSLYYPRGTAADSFVIPITPPKDDPVDAYNRAMRII